jgi:hypothetical protein
MMLLLLLTMMLLLDYDASYTSEKLLPQKIAADIEGVGIKPFKSACLKKKSKKGTTIARQKKKTNALTKIKVGGIVYLTRKKLYFVGNDEQRKI